MTRTARIDRPETRQEFINFCGEETSHAKIKEHFQITTTTLLRWLSILKDEIDAKRLEHRNNAASTIKLVVNGRTHVFTTNGSYLREEPLSP